VLGADRDVAVVVAQDSYIEGYTGVELLQQLRSARGESVPTILVCHRALVEEERTPLVQRLRVRAFLNSSTTDEALVSAVRNLRASEIKESPELLGRLAENAAGAALVRLADQNGGELFYWRDRDGEGDYVFKIGRKVIAIEVKSGNISKTEALNSFLTRNKDARGLIIGGLHSTKDVAVIKLEDFLKKPEQILI